MSSPIDGSADHEISVKGLPNLEVGDWTRVPVEEPAANKRGKERQRSEGGDSSEDRRAGELRI